MSRFPVGKYGRQTLRFHPAPYRAPLRAFAVLMFAWRGDEVLICDICGRGWCVPSGRVEPEESSAEAAQRESIEESGAVLDRVHYLGCYEIRERREVRWADCFAGNVVDLVEIGTTEESRGRKFVTLAELPGIYHQWSELTAMVFERSREVLARSEEWMGS